MKILFVNSIGKHKWGGGEKWLILAAKGLIGKGHNVTIGCYPESILNKKAEENDIPVLHLNIKSDLSFRGAIQLHNFFNTKKPDIVVCVQNRDLMFAGLGSSWGYSPVLISRHGVKLIKKSPKHRFVYGRFCKGLITNTNTIKKEYDSYGWWDNDFVKVIYNGVEENNITDEEFDLHSVVPNFNENAKIVVSIGRLSKQKGFKYFIEAVSEVVKKYPDAYFFIVGRGREKKRLLNLIKSKGLQNKLFILPFLNNVKPILNTADLFVLPSLYEGMPNAVLEALSCKLPVICTRVNGADELFGEDNSSDLLPPADKDRLRDAILDFLNSGKTGYDEKTVYHRIKNKFSLKTMVENIEAYLKEKVSKK